MATSHSEASTSSTRSTLPGTPAEPDEHSNSPQSLPADPASGSPLTAAGAMRIKMYFEELQALMENFDPTAGMRSNPIFTPQLLREVTVLYDHLKSFEEFGVSRNADQPATVEFLESLMSLCPSENIKCKAVYCRVGIRFAKACAEHAFRNHWTCRFFDVGGVRAEERLAEVQGAVVVCSESKELSEIKLAEMQTELDQKAKQNNRNMDQERKEYKRLKKGYEKVVRDLEKSDAIIAGMEMDAKKEKAKLQDCEDEVQRLDKLMSKTGTQKLLQEIADLNNEEKKQSRKDAREVELRKRNATLSATNSKQKQTIKDKDEMIGKLKEQNERYDAEVKELEDKLAAYRQRSGSKGKGKGNRKK